MCLLTVPIFFHSIHRCSKHVVYIGIRLMCLLAVPFFLHSIHRCLKHVIYIDIRLMCHLAVAFFFFILYIDVLSTRSLYRYKANVSPYSTVFF